MSGDDSFIDVDGSVLEGGGQILRISVALSAILGKSIRISGIRAGRSKPGLRPQHLTGLCLVRDLCRGILEGAEVGSTSITFKPGKITAGDYSADVKTAGSVALLMQVALPVTAFADGPVNMVLRGGTNADMAPQIDYVIQVFKPVAERFGLFFDCNIRRRGYFPKGGGEVFVSTKPVRSLTAVELLDRGELSFITGRSWVAGVLPIKVAHEMTNAATSLIRQNLKVKAEIETVKESERDAVGNGSGIVLVAGTSTNCIIGADALGEPRKNGDVAGSSAANAMIKQIQAGGCVDEHLQDQLIILMTLASGISKMKCGPLTLHTQTAIHIAQLMTDAKFSVHDNNDDQTKVIECRGIDLQNGNL